MPFFRKREYAIAASCGLLALISGLDYLTGHEISSALFYLFPIYLVASHSQAKKNDAIVIAIISSISWLLVDILTEHPHSSLYVLMWNASVRAIIFFAIAILAYRINLENRVIAAKNEELTKLNAEKNKFIGVAAHDIRTPLGNIFNLTTLLLDPRYNSKFTEDKRDEIIGMIRSSSSGCLELLNNMLDITQIESGTLRLNLKENDYVGFLREVIATNEPLAQQKDQQIVLESSVESLWLTFDKTYINQVLTNLLTNAMKYSHPDCTIQVRLQEQEGRVRTEVIDQGIGIREQDREKIFKPFEKTQNRPTAGESSNGLGLAIVKKIIEAHGGRIGFSSEHGKGSTFYFILPKQLPPPKENKSSV
uniref:histidine kinase n=1 Tax=Roseihalotalea indica TaxID=2867963 RepID=A0AA49GN28_9BACT|nr:HAMP domain-containing sensor histidine kinase [Tunicatimonas sp. TK19036]